MIETSMCNRYISFLAFSQGVNDWIHRWWETGHGILWNAEHLISSADDTNRKFGSSFVSETGQVISGLLLGNPNDNLCHKFHALFNGIVHYHGFRVSQGIAKYLGWELYGSRSLHPRRHQARNQASLIMPPSHNYQALLMLLQPRSMVRKWWSNSK